ncbi:MAG: DinB family protein, partial [Trueperaceae bacterium]
LRAFEGVSETDGGKRLEPVNSLGWMIGHLAWHEQVVWLTTAQGQTPVPELNELATRKPASTPSIEEMWRAWHTVTQAADRYLDTLTTEQLQDHYEVQGKPLPEDIGTSLQRLIYHYWYHLGESQVVRRLLGHTGLYAYVGRWGTIPPYRPDV